MRAARTEPGGAPQRSGRSWRAPAIALLATALVVLGVLAALFLLGADSPESPVDSPSDQSTSTPPAGDGTDDATVKKTGGGKKGDGKPGNRPGTGPKRQSSDGPVEEPPADTGSEEQKPVPSSG